MSGNIVNIGATSKAKDALQQLQSLHISEEELRQWISSQLQKFLGLDNVDELTNYILEFQNEQDLRKYLTEFLGSGKNTTRFIDTLLEKKKKYAPARKLEVPEDVQVYMKSKTEEDPAGKKKLQKSPEKYKDKDNIITETSINGIKVKKVKGKQSGQKDTSSQRMCDCMATEHELIANCLVCGKIICAAEGPGPCLFCEMNKFGIGDTPNVVTAEPLNPSVSESLEKAMQHKDQLLEFDRTAKQRTVVYDDQADYYSMNQWLTAKEREELELQKKHEEERKRKEEEKRKNKITFDFAGRKVIVGEEPSTASSLPKDNINQSQSTSSSDVHMVSNPTIHVQRPLFTDSKSLNQKQPKEYKKKPRSMKHIHSRVQHDYYEDESLKEE